MKKIKEKFKNLIYIFQLSHYDEIFFLNWLKRHPNQNQWLNLEKKSKLVWTRKVKVIYSLGILFYFLNPLRLIWGEKLIPKVIIFITKMVSIYEFFVSKFLSLFLKFKLKKYKNLKIIGITGSYGKTTTKEFISKILSSRFKVLKTPENINTFWAIILFLKNAILEDIDFLIIEMAAYHKGDIKKIASLVKPDIGILTGLNPTHLERFGSFENIIKTKFELAYNIKMGGIFIFNNNCEVLKKEVEKRISDFKRQRLEIFSYGFGDGMNIVEGRLVDLGENYIIGEFRFGDKLLKKKINVIGEHQLEPILAGLTLGFKLGMSIKEVELGLEKIKPQDRRLFYSYQPNNILVIDDSYNSSIDGLNAACEAVRIIKRRKIGIFGGIAEGGEETESLNKSVGKLIGKNFDIIILVRTYATEYILLGLKETNFSDKNLVLLDDARDVDQILKTLAQPGDLIYFSTYDWPDHYY